MYATLVMTTELLITLVKFCVSQNKMKQESMIKSFHRNLKGKIKIICKPRLIGNEIKNLSDAASNIVLNMELYEGKDIMAAKEYADGLGATAATSVRLPEPYHGSGRIIIADSWFGSVKTVGELRNRGLYSIMIVKTAHKQYPRLLLPETALQRKEWEAYTATIDGVEYQACRFLDLKMKDSISTYSTAIPGRPRQTRHHGLVPRPQVAEQYLKNSASIDVHNHYRTGSCGFEDIWHTKNPHRRQLAGILGFCFTNSFLAMKYFTGQKTLPHHSFKMTAANALVSTSLANSSFYATSSILDNSIDPLLHEMERI